MCVCVCVCLSVITPAPTSHISTLKIRYVGVYLRLFSLFNVWNFDKSFRSEVSRYIALSQNSGSLRDRYVMLAQGCENYLSKDYKEIS